MYPPNDPRSLPTFSAPLLHGRTLERRAATGIHIELRAHCALTPPQARWFLFTVSIGPILTAGFCLLQGFWPVLPFAGLELVLLWFVLRVSMRRGQRQELIAITAEFVTIEVKPCVSPVNSRFPRHWTRVKLSVPHSTQLPSRLALESQGHACEVGSFLTDVERRALAVRLQQLVGNMNDSPAL